MFKTNIDRRNATKTIAITAIAGLFACTDTKTTTSITAEYPKFGRVERLDPELDMIIDADARLEQLADGFSWSEGPIWDAKRNKLYFSDVPENTAYAWSKDKGLEILIKPAGPEGGDGTNGLLMARDGRLLTANHGKRAITAYDLDTKTDTILADDYQGKKFNSPNDLIETKDGVIFFTDPPYGLDGQDDSALKEMAFNGVYRRKTNGDISVIDNSLTRPNGIILSPDEKTLYVAQSDSEAQIIKSYNIENDDISDNDNIIDQGIFYDATPLSADDAPGLPDGMCVAQTGHIFATGPGGILILSPDGRLLGRILAEKATANCAFGDDGKTLYLTSSDRLARIMLKVKGVGNY